MLNHEFFEKSFELFLVSESYHASEKHIQDAMLKLMENRTSLIIAHRLSTIQDADIIVVMDEGHIVEAGNHKELLNKMGRYYKLYMTQFAGQTI